MHRTSGQKLVHRSRIEVRKFISSELWSIYDSSHVVTGRIHVEFINLKVDVVTMDSATGTDKSDQASVGTANICSLPMVFFICVTAALIIERRGEAI